MYRKLRSLFEAFCDKSKILFEFLMPVVQRDVATTKEPLEVEMEHASVRGSLGQRQSILLE